MTTMVIVGAGTAGATAALTLRDEGFGGRIVLLGEQEDEPYRTPPLSKDLLRGTTPEEKLFLRPSKTWQDKEVELRTRRRVTSLDTDRSVVGLDDGSEIGYDRLLLATGGAARTLPAAPPGAHVLRTLEDARKLRAALHPDRHLLVLGAGTMGSEIAASARALGCPVTMLEAAPTPMGRLLPARVGRACAELHRRHGVDLHTEIDVERLELDGDRYAATDADGRRWTADTVVVATGSRPRTELAEQAGIGVDDGVLVDEFFSTSVPGVFAAGDVARQPNPTLGGWERIEHWQNAQEHGAAAAKSMLGSRTPFVRVPWCWTEQYGVNLQSCGWPAWTDETTVRGSIDELDFSMLFHREGRLVGAIGANRPAEIRSLRKLVLDAPFTDPATLLEPANDLRAVAARAAGWTPGAHRREVPGSCQRD